MISGLDKVQAAFDHVNVDTQRGQGRFLTQCVALHGCEHVTNCDLAVLQFANIRRDRTLSLTQTAQVFKNKVGRLVGHNVQGLCFSDHLNRD